MAGRVGNLARVRVPLRPEARPGGDYSYGRNLGVLTLWDTSRAEETNTPNKKLLTAEDARDKPQRTQRERAAAFGPVFVVLSMSRCLALLFLGAGRSLLDTARRAEDTGEDLVDVA